MTGRTARGGTYTLLVELQADTHIEVGALGDLSFAAGWYAYTGSALGPGGFARVDRHRELAAGQRPTRHWHIDYLLGHDATDLDTVVRSTGLDAECHVATNVDGDPVHDFGCSDCECPSHLQYSPRRAPLVDAVFRAHRAVRGGDGEGRRTLG